LNPFGKEDAVTSLKTNESTLRALRAASEHPPGAAEVKKQRISFIMGSLNKESAVTRAKVVELLAEQEGSKDRK
jgi:hypothetical protein